MAPRTDFIAPVYTPPPALSPRGGPPRDRPRFARFRLSRLADGRCRARVTLDWSSRGRFQGEAEALGAGSGELRAGALACLDALTQGVPGLAFDLLGTKAIRAFDANVVLVSLALRGDPRSPRLVGSCLAGERLGRAAALAVLNAVNRLVTTSDSPAAPDPGATNGTAQASQPMTGPASLPGRPSLT